MTQDEISAYDRLVIFKKHLKMAVGLVIEDVHTNFEAYKVTPHGKENSSDNKMGVPTCKIVLKKNESKNPEANYRTTTNAPVKSMIQPVLSNTRN